jgi:hypothetical protein
MSLPKPRTPEAGKGYHISRGALKKFHSQCDNLVDSQAVLWQAPGESEEAL